jgi:membrane protein YdbS with pleckstrin-like domain
MLTEEEEKFMIYWEANRLRRKKVFTQLAVGLPMAVLLVVAIFVNFFAGWYKRADAMLHSQGSMILVLVVAAILIVIFITVFSARHKWEMYEQRYLELQAKRDQR